ncbi:MAG: 3-deoxy-7-phosphoheptulonate synthase [Chloroflexi bacterium]|nr:3-deoxy-7-phosphoheptulonate synthase [Chloroflexota bacterium]MBM3182782.1 3-deoxy-7-phosphoheptulonate synthase [Chloroflexota bacterium]MBM4452369.1 3-deoxy-7-phosphoheptulonate synthase [Chloroflexota bacterium]MBM4453980.1 3-deoxy-7-phosphoheptulonate synthase [Chloroflexota bacterium]
MIVVMRVGATDQQINAVMERIRAAGLKEHLSHGVERTIIGVLGQIYPELKDTLEVLPGVDEVIRVSKPYKLSSREFHPEDTRVKVGGVTIGGEDVVVIAGPCAVESEKQLFETAHAVRAAGATVLRGGAFKPSTSPYSFRGLGERGLELLAQMKAETGLPVITEVMTVADVDLVARYADILQIGARNMQNFFLLEEAGKAGKPVMLKRGLSATIEEWLLAAEYILAQGNKELILCERGIRTFESYTRNTMDISAIPVIEKVSHLPIIADPSHGTGKWHLVTPMALAAVAAGADGIMVEVHPNPDSALKDGAQSLNFDNFRKLMKLLAPVAAAVGRRLVSP